MAELNVDEIKQEYKNTIEELINSNKITEAKYMIDEYEKRVKNDIDIFSMKAVIAIIENRFVVAESILDDGLKIDNNNFDMIYNKAYIYEVKNDIKMSIQYYNRAIEMSNSIEKISEMKNIIKNLKCKKSMDELIKKKILIGSPIHQKPNILKEFLSSLDKLNTEEFEIAYIFIDDNENSESSKILNSFLETHREVIICKSENVDNYNCNKNTHFWNEKLIWKVANFKNAMIKKAIELNFDYLFLIDSDLVMHPKTIKQLVLSEKDIISNIFWTKWSPNDEMRLPQVWISDQYVQYYKARNERISNEEVYLRHLQFINELKTPGTYEVGGLGACTLISRNALKSGVNFSEIKNVSFHGEDRHFCIRAQALGFNLYVDTHYPAYHIYREEDLAGVMDFKNKCDSGEFFIKKKISMVHTGLSGSNTMALLKLVPGYIKSKYDIEILRQSNSSQYIKSIMNSDVVIVTEGNYFLNKKTFNEKQKVIDLWHGFPLKAMGYVDKSEEFKDKIEFTWSNVDYITSYSKLFNKVMNKCINIPKDKYIITGAPRNDLLYISDGRSKLENLLKRKLCGKKVIFYMPTYRYTTRGNRVDGGRKWDNIFDIDGLDEKRLNTFLEQNNLFLILKIHPAEEVMVREYIKENSNIHLISSFDLENNDIDLYEILNSADLLITDYSSVYFDYLLLDRPIIFVPNDLEYYNSTRGFLLEPYEKWTPGPKVFNQESLENEILTSLNDNSYYKKQREEILNLVHKNSDGNSSVRVWKFIDKLMSCSE